MTTLSIGEVASRSGVPVETVRYYAREKLILRASRDANGYRRFRPEAVSQIRQIQSAAGCPACNEAIDNRVC